MFGAWLSTMFIGCDFDILSNGLTLEGIWFRTLFGAGR